MDSGRLWRLSNLLLRSWGERNEEKKTKKKDVPGMNQRIHTSSCQLADCRVPFPCLQLCPCVGIVKGQWSWMPVLNILCGWGGWDSGWVLIDHLMHNSLPFNLYRTAIPVYVMNQEHVWYWKDCQWVMYMIGWFSLAHRTDFQCVEAKTPRVRYELTTLPSRVNDPCSSVLHNTVI